MYFNEPMPDCVPEFYRSKLEEQERCEDRQLREQDRYLANRMIIEAAIAAGLPVLNYGGFPQCQTCPHADHDTQTDAEDDFDRVICYNPACQCHKNQTGGGE